MLPSISHSRPHPRLFTTPAIVLLLLGLGLTGVLSTLRADPSTPPDYPPDSPQAQGVHKPPPGSEINWKHPLAEGLVSALPLNEGSGIKFYDAVTKQTYIAATQPGSPKDAQLPAWINPPVSTDYPWGGPAISNNNATAQSITSTLKDAQFIQNVKTGYSYAVLVQPLDENTFGRIMDGTGAAVITFYLNIGNGKGNLSGKVATTWRVADGGATVPSAKFKVNEWILVLCTVQDGLG